MICASKRVNGGNTMLNEELVEALINELGKLSYENHKLGAKILGLESEIAELKGKRARGKAIMTKAKVGASKAIINVAKTIDDPAKLKFVTLQIRNKLASLH